MRASEFSQSMGEARRNPEQNPKRSGRLEAAQYLTQAMRDGGNWGVSFTDVNKLGINPRTSFDSSAVNAATPAGVYFYPAKYFINMVKEGIQFPFADDAAYLQVFKYEPKNMLVINTATFADWQRVVKILGVEREAEQGWGASIMLTVDRYLQENPSKTSETWELHRIFRKLGYDALLDLGMGAIQGNEPYCGVILDTGIIKGKKTFNNIQPRDPANLQDKAVDPWQKQKARQPKPTGKYLDPEEAFNYARDVIHGRWYAAEPIIAQDEWKAQEYHDLFVGGDFDDWFDSVSQTKLQEAPLPPDWDPEKLNLRQTFKNRLKYALERAKRIGTGSSRVAMVIDYQGRNTVLKVAKNLKGLAQNEAELEILNDYVLGQSEIVISLIDYDKANKRPVWIQTELASQISMKPLLQLLRTPTLWFLTDAVKYRLALPDKPKYLNKPGDLKEKYFDPKMWSYGGQPSEQSFEMFNEYVDKIAELKDSSQLELGDLQNNLNWGQFMGRPVVIDLGLSSEVWQKLYKV